MAAVLAQSGDTAAAVRTALDAEAIGRAHLRLTVGYLPERQALGYAARRPKGLDLALSFGGGDPQVAPRLLDEVVQGRSLVLDEMAVRQRDAIDPSRPELGPLWQAVRAARQRLANLVVRGATPGQEARHQALVDEARAESERAERALSERSLVFRQVEARADVGLNEVRAALAPGTALVSYVHYARTVLPAAASRIDTVRVARRDDGARADCDVRRIRAAGWGSRTRARAAGIGAPGRRAGERLAP